MTSQMNTKVRLVRCPRCRQVLPELPEVPVYKCGGCGAILQAKNRKNDTKDTGSRVHEADPTQKNELEHVSEDKEASRFNKKENIPSSEESDLDKILERGQSGREWLGDGNQSNESPCHENADSSPETRAHTEADEDKFPLDQYSIEDHNESGDSDREQPGDINVSNEVSSSTELNHHENKLSLLGYEDESLSSSPREVDESQYSSENNNGGGQSESGNCDQEWPININFSKAVSSSDECTSHETEEPFQVAGADREVDENLKSHSILRSPSAENFLKRRPQDQNNTAQSSSGENVLSDNLMSPRTESMEQAQNGILPGFERVSSADTLENMPLVYSKSELGVKLRSPTARSYYAYDGSASSCNETDNQVPNRHFHPSKRNFKDEDSVSTKGLPKRDAFMVNHVMSSESELQRRPMNSASILPGKKHYATKGSKWHQDDFLEPTRHSHPVRSIMRMETDEYVSRLPFYSKGSQAGYGNGIPSSYGQNNFPENPESDKMELLRMVYELQDQLNRMQISKRMPNGRFSTRVAKRAEQISSYNYHFTPEREIYPDLNYPSYPGGYSQGKTWSQQGKVSQMAFSGDDTHCRHQVDCSCLHCCRKEWHYSPELPPHVCCNKGHSVAHHSHNCYSPYHSASSSPQHYTGSEFSLWSRDTKPDDQQHKDHEAKKLYMREQHHLGKQHFRPIAGGAPIIACYRCFELLQLPADFLLFKRRCHRLICSACSEVLKFSLQNRSHLVRYSPDLIAPPSSEVDDYPDAIKKRNLASASRASDCSHAEPMSCSDDYGQSFCRSCSTEVDPFSLSPFETLNRISDHRKMSSGTSFEPIKEGKKKSIMEESESKYKNHVETFDPPGPSSKMSKPDSSSSEIEEVPPATSSPLHWLMGYSSPSHLVYK